MKKILNAIGEIRSQMLYIMTSRQKKQCVGVFIIIFIGSFFEMLGVTAVLPFIQAVLDPKQLIVKWNLKPVLDAFGVRSDIDIILFLGMVLIFVYIIKNLYLSFSSYLQIKFKLRMEKDLSVLMLRTYMRRPYSYFLEVNSGDILRGIKDDILAVHTILDVCFKILVEGITLILIIVFLIITDPLMTTGAIGIAVVCFLCITLGMKKRMNFLGVRQREAVAKQNKYAYQAVNGIKEITVMQRNEDFIRQYEDAYEVKRSTSVAYEFIQVLPERIIEGMCISGIIGMVCFRCAYGFDVSEFIPKLAVFAVAFFRVLPSISRLTGYFSGIVFYRPGLHATYDNIKAARDYEEYLENYALGSNATSEESPKDSFDKEVFVDNITWKYENSPNTVLDGLSLRIEKGESVAFIGASGAGKTTLADIILGLLKPQKGSVYVDGTDIFTIRKSWSHIIGYVPQTVFLLDETVRTNILFGLPEEDGDDEKVWKALEKAQLKSFIEQLPGGLDTIVGERGIKFSGGQRQRIAIARALYYNPEILVLDEATSALDNETETAVIESIEALQGHKTLIIVAHRLTTIRNCDKIYEIKDGAAWLREKEEILKDL